MSINPPNGIVQTRDPNAWVSYAFLTILILIGLVTGLGLLASAILVAYPQGSLTGQVMLAITGVIVVALTAGALVLGGLLAHRRMLRLTEQLTVLEQQTAIMAEQSLARTQADTYAGKAIVDPEELRGLLQNIHEALLLPEEERARRFKQMVERAFAQRLAAAQQYVNTHDFHRAREELNRLAERFGADPRIPQARQRLEQVAAAALSNDIKRVTQHVDDLIGMSRWDEAERAARELATRYPQAKEPAVLVERILRERKAFEVKHRQRMHEEIQQFVHERRWQEALKGARQFIQNFPTGPDTDALREQLSTLEANADIQARQTLERYIKQYIQEKKYWDAVALARRIIAEHPLSPQANALRGQMPRLEELARAQAPQPSGPAGEPAR